MTNFRVIFEDDWCGIEKFLTEVLVPIFGEYQKGYDILTKDAEVKKRASLANITEIKHTATFDLIGSEIKVFDISVSDKKRLAQSRVGIQQVVRQYVNQFEGALIVFHHENVKNQEWRLSYVEKLTGAKDTTSAKRYTYILGKEYHARTITERFNSLLEKKHKGLLLKDLTDAFSVEPLSDEFFDKYREHYADLVEYISGKRYVKKGGKFVETKVSRANPMFKEVFNQDDKEVRDFVKKMMGRLVFLQFLQKKGWLGVDINGDWGSGDKNFLYNLFQNASEDVKKDFLNEVLNPLFFKTLNTDRGVESVAPKAVCDVYAKKVRIPYLNGGLFEEEEIDKKHVKFRKEDFDKLFNFFTEYNFTIDESDPVDVEIGIDPEMLGKIFENLLEDNKDKGAFYTPKEIVQYMCRESLIAYLSNCYTNSKLLRNFSDAEDRIRQFVLKQETNLFSDDEKKVLLKAIRDIKVCDPAVGSGAFPMGMLNELYACRVALGENEDAAEIKKQIVRESIYGVDIEKGAVDIARLRFWLAIIVDEKVPIPLPNLDYKIMQGNSLLESYKGVDLSRLTETDVGELGFGTDEIADLVKAIDGYYTPNDQVAKNKIRKTIQDKVIALLKAKGFAKEKDFYEQLSKIDLHSNSEFFLWHTWFSDVFGLDVGSELDIRSETIVGSGEILKSNDYRLMSKGGFDIVIGNPPYVSSDTQRANLVLNEQREKLLKSKRYKSLHQKWDLYIPFIELGLQLNKPNGITTMIVPFPLTNQVYAKVLRKMLVEEYDLFELVDLNGTKIFEKATVSNCIPFIRKMPHGFDFANAKSWISKIDEKLNISRVFEQSKSDLVQDEKNYVWNVTQEKRETNRHADMHVLGDYCYVSYGLRPNSDEKTAKGEFKKEDLISEIEDGTPRRKYIEAKDIEKYKINRIRYLEYGTRRSPAKLARPTFNELYEPTKLMFNVLGELTGTIDTYKLVHNHSLIACVLWKDLHGVENKSIASSIKKFSSMNREDMKELSKTVDLRFLLGVMNSKYASVLLTNLRGGDYHIYPEHIRNIPIPSASSAQQKPIIALVDKILAAKKANPAADTSALETQIDELVYDLYGLTEEEKEIIRGR